MTFDQPYYLLLFTALPLGVYLYHRLLRAPLVGWRRLQLPVALAAFALLIFALAQPRWGKGARVQSHQPRNLVLLIDVSRSMLAHDAHPNRLESTKAALSELIPTLRGERVAVIAFRSKPTLLCPLTTDQHYLRQTLEALTPYAAPSGETDLARAIYEALRLLDPDEDAINAILLVTDGEDLTEEVAQALKVAKKRHVPIHTVGVGTSKGSTIIDELGEPLKYRNEVVVTRLNEGLLRSIAELSGGRYLPPQGGAVMPASLQGFVARGLKDQEVKMRWRIEEQRSPSRYVIFLVPSIVLFVILSLFSKGRVVSPNRK